MRYEIITGLVMLCLVLGQPTHAAAASGDRDHGRHDAQAAEVCGEIPAQGLKIVIPFDSGSAELKTRQGHTKKRVEQCATKATPSEEARQPLQARQEPVARTEQTQAEAQAVPPGDREALQPEHGTPPETPRPVPRQASPVEVQEPQPSPPMAALAPLPLPPSTPDMTPPAAAEGLYQQALTTYQRGNYDRAIAMFTHLIQQYPHAPQAAPSQLWIGNALYAQQRYEEAIEAFDAVIQIAPRSPSAPVARLRQAHAFAALQDVASARAVLKKVQKDYAGSAEAHEAAQQLHQLGRSGAHRAVDRRR